MDYPLVSMLGGLTVAGITVLSFWIRFAQSIAAAESAAKAASLVAEAARISAHDANEKVGIQAAAFSIYREQIAREYIHREVMREVEERLTAAIERLGDRLDRVLERSDSPLHK